MDRLSVLFLCLFCALSGILLGSIVTTKRLQSEHTLSVVPSQVSRLSTVRIEEVGSVFTGTASGAVRLFLGEKPVAIEHGAFRVTLTKPAQPPSLAPAGMRFVASKRGKYYYRVNTAAANGLSESNRVYFGTEEEARQAGFKKR